MSDLLGYALGHAADGFRVFPAVPRDKPPAVKAWQEVATTDPAAIRAWWEKNPDYNVALYCGDGLMVLDVDEGKGGKQSLAKLIEEHGTIRTKMVRTGNGFHLYFKDDPKNPFPQTAGRIAPGIDSRSAGNGYVIGAGSVHPSGVIYEAVNGAAPGMVPDWLRELATTARKAKADPSEPIPAGQRNGFLASRAGVLQRHGMSPAALKAALWEENLERCVPPLSEAEVAQIAGSVGRYAPEAHLAIVPPEEEFEADQDAVPPPVRVLTGMVEFTDEWARAMVQPHVEERLRYLPGSSRSNGRWYVWTGVKWAWDQKQAHENIIRDRLTQIALELQERAARAPSKKEGARVLRAAERYQSAAGINSVIQLMQAKIPCQPSEFDADLWALNTPGGLVDLKTGDTRPATPADMLTRATGVAPVPGPKPLWMKFLADLTQRDVALQEYLQKMVGYSLTGDVSEKTLWFIWGADADTGKSTFIRVLSELFGDYHDSVDVSAFISGFSGDRIPADLARLPGVRLVTATEPAAGHSWDERRIKSITGGDAVNARFLYGQWFNFQPQFKIAIVGNHEPEIKNVDDAMLRRIHIVPFDHKVPRDKQVDNLSQILVEREGPAIMAWLIEGCRLWQEDGLQPPESVLKKTAAYEMSEDTMGQWIEEECEVHPEVEETRDALYSAWKIWCQARGEDPGGAKGFKRKMDSRRSLKLQDKQLGDRRLQGYRGIRLRLRSAMGTEDFNAG